MDQRKREPDVGMEPPPTGQAEAAPATRKQGEAGATRRARRPVRSSTRRQGRTEGTVRGVDREWEDRPGVPMEAEPTPERGAHWEEPERQEVTVHHLKREGLERLTPVVGTAQPPRGLSGVLRRKAYGIPEHRARHWGLLLMADRVDVAEDRLGRGLGALLRGAGLRQMARRAERNPLPMVAGMLLAGLVIGRAVRSGR